MLDKQLIVDIEGVAVDETWTNPKFSSATFRNANYLFSIATVEKVAGFSVGQLIFLSHIFLKLGNEGHDLDSVDKRR